MSKIVEKYAELPKIFRKPLWKWWHRKMNKYDSRNIANFMNYGYEYLNEDLRIQLKDQDEIDRYCIQLYDHVVKKFDLKTKDVLEVGSGRGGGASYISRYYEPKSYTGMDITKSSIEFCNNHYKNVEALSFICGNAEKLPFDDSLFDFVINVESARCYNNQLAFFNEVFRVLKADGKLLLADMIYPDEIDKLRSLIKQSGFKILEETNISKNVVSALQKDSERRENLIDEKMPKFLRKPFKTFAGTLGTSRYDNFASGTFQYLSFILEKQTK
jgi:ubiquinone/menaquinone biosynthesis C-methylase UbiE